MLMIGFSRKISMMLIASVMLLATSCIKDEKHTGDDTTMVGIGQCIELVRQRLHKFV